MCSGPGSAPTASGLFASLFEDARSDQPEGHLGMELLRIRRMFDQVDVGALVVDRAARRVLVLGRELRLPSKEYALVLRLAQDPDRVFSREQLLRDVWGYRTFVPTRTVESHASRVRCKLAAAGLPGWIVNEWGVGYRLRPDLLEHVDPA